MMHGGLTVSIILEQLTKRITSGQRQHFCEMKLNCGVENNAAFSEVGM